MVLIFESVDSILPGLPTLLRNEISIKTQEDDFYLEKKNQCYIVLQLKITSNIYKIHKAFYKKVKIPAQFRLNFLNCEEKYFKKRFQHYSSTTR